MVNAGRTVTKADIDSQIGNVCLNIQVVMDQIKALKLFLDQYTSANMVTNWAYVQADSDIVKSAIADADQLRTIYEGTANLTVAKDFTAFTKQLRGIPVH